MSAPADEDSNVGNPESPPLGTIATAASSARWAKLRDAFARN
jgi:hypothetical protein